MTQNEKDRLQYMIDVMTAYRDGKTIQMKLGNKRSDDDWEDWSSPLWDWESCDYRIKSEPTKPQYRPFESADEVMEAIKEHGTYLTTDLEYGNRIQIVEFNDHNIWCGAGAKMYPLRYYFEMHFMFCDGTPFGKLIEE